MTEWQPIDTAPKDGTVIWLYDPVHNYQQKGSFCTASIATDMGWEDGWMLVDEQCGGWGWICEPSHWTPLPEPPIRP